MFRLFSILLLILVCLPLGTTAQEYHQFTSKDGKQMSAMLLDISEDNRQVKIRREDGLEFQFEIVALSLDDQQHIKDWLKNRVVEVKTDYRLEVEIDHKAVESERHRRDSYYTYEQRFGAYEIVARNLSRETLPAATLEYIVVWNERLRVYESADSGWTYSYNSSTSESPKVKLSGKTDLGEMVYNRDAEFTTEVVEINRYLFDGKVYREDELLGMIVRILDSHGNVLLEQRSPGSDVDDLSWEDAMALRDGAPKT